MVDGEQTTRVSLQSRVFAGLVLEVRLQWYAREDRKVFAKIGGRKEPMVDGQGEFG